MYVFVCVRSEEEIPYAAPPTVARDNGEGVTAAAALGATAVGGAALAFGFRGVGLATGAAAAAGLDAIVFAGAAVDPTGRADGLAGTPA